MSRYIIIVLFVYLIVGQTFSQRLPESQQPVILKPVNHQKDFKTKFRILEQNSFYQSKDQWQTIIDSTWGPGIPYSEKIEIFNRYTQAITSEFDGFNSLQMSQSDWDSLKNAYFVEITDSTSCGAFAALMMHLAGELKDIHTRVDDDSVVSTPLNPGTPLLLISGFFDSIEHFGAVLTVLPDSNLLVLRTVDGHPLNLQPGDIILGYEGKRWKNLIIELLEARIPIYGRWPGAPSAYQEALQISAGMNWHLFDTIDILKYSSGDTIHLSVAPLIDLSEVPMLNNEQVPVPGVPFPDYFDEQYVSSGIIEDSNIGYIYLFEENYISADAQFYEALLPLLDTDGLIIDMRLNFGGWSLFNNSFALLFNENIQTIESVYRCDPPNFDLCAAGDFYLFTIPGNPNTIFDHPIAVLLGPTCVSMGDITAQRLRYHPMAKFFGKPPAASLGDNLYIEDFNGWTLRYSICDQFHVVRPGSYLNREEFPLDIPVWFDPYDVAEGNDTVVEKAIEWMENIAYSHDLTIDKVNVQPGIDSILITTLVENPNRHEISVTTSISNNKDITPDTLILYDDGEHGDREMNDGLWGNYYLPLLEESMYLISVKSEDMADQTQFTLPNVKRFTSAGPVLYNGYFANRLRLTTFTQKFYFKIRLQNLGQQVTVENIGARVNILSADSCFIMEDNYEEFGNIAPGENVDGTVYHTVNIDTSCIEDSSLLLSFNLEIYSNGYMFWTDTFSIDIPVDITEEEFTLPKRYALNQNYPNPFNPVTKINYQLPITNYVELSIYNLLGQKVATLVSEKQKTGYHHVEWDASNHASGVYYYQIKAGEFQDVKKMILLR